MENLKKLKRRIVEISYKHKLSHIGSCLTSLPIIDAIYNLKKPEDRFILSAGHAGLALYVVLEERLKLNAEELLLKHGIHPNRDVESGIDASTGSLGHGIGIAVGMALADRKRKVYCLISDGECAEGSVWEALRVKRDQKLDNLIVYANLNKWGAYKEIPVFPLFEELRAFGVIPIIGKVEQLPCLKGNEAHYRVMSEKDYNEAMEALK